MGTTSRWRAVSVCAAALLGAVGVVGLAPDPAAGQVSGSAALTTAPAAAEQVPIVDGVRRFNVGATHSPELLRKLVGPRSKTGLAAAAASTSLGGVDVADYQHPNGAPINWAEVASAGYTFAAIKATEGNYYVNPYYASDVAEAKAAGLHVAGYHFAIPNVSDGVTQADYAVSNSDYAVGGQMLPLELDIEYDPYSSNECYGLSQAQMVAWITAFVDEVQRLTGKLPIIYTTADWWDTCTGSAASFGADPLWVAAYGTGSPLLPAGWSSWTFWQYTATATVPGIPGSVDADYFDGSSLSSLG